MRPGGDAGELLRRDDMEPPILSRPGRPGESLPPPATRGRSDRQAPNATRSAPCADWIGADDARASAC